MDSNQLENALLNLTINARDSMPDGGKLTIDTSNSTLDEEFLSRHADATPGQYVLMTVTDSGHGMSSETVAQVFDPFFTTKRIGQRSADGRTHVCFLCPDIQIAIIHGGSLNDGIRLLQKPFTKTQLARKIRQSMRALRHWSLH